MIVIIDISIDDVEKYLQDVKEAITNDRYRIEMNENRKDNRDLFLDYVISEKKRKNILMNLTVSDFSEVIRNEHKGFEHELLFVFGKEVKLLKRFESDEEVIPLYIKINKLGSGYVIVISFHKQRYPIKYKFKERGN